MDFTTFLRPPEERIITLPEAASMLGISVDTLRRRNKAGEIEIVRLSPRRVGVRLQDLRNFINCRAA